MMGTLGVALAASLSAILQVLILYGCGIGRNEMQEAARFTAFM